MKSLIPVKFCTFLLIGTSLGQAQNGQEKPQIQVTTIQIDDNKSGTDASTGGLTQQGLKLVYSIANPTANFAKDIGKWMLNMSSAVEKKIVEAGKEAIQVGSKLGVTAMNYVNKVTTGSLKLPDSGSTEEKSKQISL